MNNNDEINIILDDSNTKIVQNGNKLDMVSTHYKNIRLINGEIVLIEITTKRNVVLDLPMEN